MEVWLANYILVIAIFITAVFERNDAANAKYPAQHSNLKEYYQNNGQTATNAGYGYGSQNQRPYSDLKQAGSNYHNNGPTSANSGPISVNYNNQGSNGGSVYGRQESLYTATQFRYYDDYDFRSHATYGYGTPSKYNDYNRVQAASYGGLPQVSSQTKTTPQLQYKAPQQKPFTSSSNTAPYAPGKGNYQGVRFQPSLKNADPKPNYYNIRPGAVPKPHRDCRNKKHCPGHKRRPGNSPRGMSYWYGQPLQRPYRTTTAQNVPAPVQPYKPLHKNVEQPPALGQNTQQTSALGQNTQQPPALGQNTQTPTIPYLDKAQNQLCENGGCHHFIKPQESYSPKKLPSEAPEIVNLQVQNNLNQHHETSIQHTYNNVYVSSNPALPDIRPASNSLENIRPESPQVLPYSSSVPVSAPHLSHDSSLPQQYAENGHARHVNSYQPGQVAYLVNPQNSAAPGQIQPQSNLDYPVHSSVIQAPHHSLPAYTSAIIPHSYSNTLIPQQQNYPEQTPKQHEQPYSNPRYPIIPAPVQHPLNSNPKLYPAPVQYALTPEYPALEQYSAKAELYSANPAPVHYSTQPELYPAPAQHSVKLEYPALEQHSVKAELYPGPAQYSAKELYPAPAQHSVKLEYPAPAQYSVESEYPPPAFSPPNYTPQPLQQSPYEVQYSSHLVEEHYVNQPLYQAQIIPNDLQPIQPQSAPAKKAILSYPDQVYSPYPAKEQQQYEPELYPISQSYSPPDVNLNSFPPFPLPPVQVQSYPTPQSFAPINHYENPSYNSYGSSSAVNQESKPLQNSYHLEAQSHMPISYSMPILSLANVNRLEYGNIDSNNYAKPYNNYDDIAHFSHLIKPAVGAYDIEFQTGSGIKQQESGYLKQLPASLSAGSLSRYDYQQPQLSNVKTGTVSWTSPEGIPFSMSYIADENGFRPTGSHIPSVYSEPTAFTGSDGSIKYGYGSTNYEMLSPSEYTPSIEQKPSS